MEKINWKQEQKDEIASLHQWAQTFMRNHLDELRPLASEVGIDLDATELSMAVYNTLIKILDDRRQAAKDYESERHYAELHAMASILKITSNINLENPTGEDLDALHVLGCALGSLERFDPDISHPDLQMEHFQKEAGREAVQGRWKPYEEIIQEGLDEARSKWEGGDAALHTEMAKYLYGKYSARRPKVSEKAWLDRLKPIAKEFGRLFGMKGVNKEK